MEEIVLWLVKIIGDMGYLGHFPPYGNGKLLFPVPSELVVPPAGYLASQGQMNIWLVIFVSTLGSLTGALFNYAHGLLSGKAMDTEVWKIFSDSAREICQSRVFFLKHGEISTFTGRLIIVVGISYLCPPAFQRWIWCEFSRFYRGRLVHLGFHTRLYWFHRRQQHGPCEGIL